MVEGAVWAVGIEVRLVGGVEGIRIRARLCELDWTAMRTWLRRCVWGSEARRCGSGRVAVLVDDATEDAGTQESAAR